MYMSKVHDYIALRGNTYYICCFKEFVLKMNYLCLDKGTEGKNMHQYNYKKFCTEFDKNNYCYLVLKLYKL